MCSSDLDDPNALIGPGDMQALASRFLPTQQGYNPVYRQARALLLELAYANAKMNNPSGEVSRFALEREMENLGQGLFGNDQGVLAVIDIAKGRMQRALGEAEILRGAAPGPTRDDPRLSRGAAPVAPTRPQPTNVPAGIDPAEWEFLTPEEKALFQ